MDLMLTDAPVYYAGSGFPWGLLIIGGIVYFLWTKGVFDGRGRWGNGGRVGGGYGGGYGPGSGPGPGQHQMTQAPEYGAGYGASQGAAGYGDQRAAFEEWHRQAHASGMTHEAPAAPQASAPPQAPAAPEAPAPGTDEPTRQV